MIGLAALVVVGSAFQPHLLAGSGRAAPPPGPPAVGDCFDGAATPAPDGAGLTAISGGTVPVYPAQQTRPCTGLRTGEVTFVLPVARPTVLRIGDANGLGRVDDPNQLTCQTKTAQYVGLATIPPLHSFWYPDFQIVMAVSGPSARQKAAGQQWVACLVTLQPTDATSADPNPAPRRYDSTLRRALRTGAQRDEIGVCTANARWIGDPNVPCRQPHELEVLAYGDSGDHPGTRAALEASCRQVVGELTSLPDPTAGGALVVQTRVVAMNGLAITTAEVPADSAMFCSIATTHHRRLGGSLLALGTGPIPWVP